MRSGILLRIVGGFLITLAVLNLASLALPEVRTILISPLTVAVRYLLMLIAGIGFVMLRMWGLYVFLLSVAINWVTFYTIYHGASINYPLWLGFLGPLVICGIFYYSKGVVKR